MRIDTYAHANHWQGIHPGSKGLLVLFALIATLLSRHLAIPLLIALTMSGLTLFGARIPWQGYLRILFVPCLFLLWSCSLLLVSIATAPPALQPLSALSLGISLNRSELPLASLVFSRSLGALCSLLFLALSTPMNELTGLLRRLGLPPLLAELMTIAYRQIFILLSAFSQIRVAQESRLGYRSFRTSWRSAAVLTGNILIKTIVRARNNHQALLARGYDNDLRFLSPQRHFSPWHLFSAGGLGLLFILLALQVQP